MFISKCKKNSESGINLSTKVWEPATCDQGIMKRIPKCFILNVVHRYPADFYLTMDNFNNQRPVTSLLGARY